MVTVAGVQVGEAGPIVGPDERGPSGPAWVITRAGHTRRGEPWFVVRMRGGRQFRTTVHGPVATEDVAREIILTRVARQPARPATLETGA